MNPLLNYKEYQKSRPVYAGAAFFLKIRIIEDQSCNAGEVETAAEA